MEEGTKGLGRTGLERNDRRPKVCQFEREDLKDIGVAWELGCTWMVGL